MTVDEALRRNELAADYRPSAQLGSNDEANRQRRAVDCTDCTLEEEACFIGISSYVTQLKKFVTAQAAQPQPVLLVAEQGLRRERVARAIHQLSCKPARAFRAVDARSHSEAALYELLFAPGGLVEACQAGMIFIDEVDQLSLPLLYRFALPVEPLRLKARAVEAAGPRLVLGVSESKSKQAATNDSFNSVMAALQPAVFRLRPLRERSEDVPYLAIYLADRSACRLNKSRHNIAHEAMLLLAAYEWEGNLDELETVLESAIAHTPPPEINETLLPGRIRRAQVSKMLKEGINLFQAVEQYEQELIAQALRQTGGKQNAAAQLLGIKPQTLNTKLKRSQDVNLDETG